MGAEAARMHDAFRDALVIEVKNLLAEMEVFERHRPANAYLERVLVVGNRDTLLRCQRRPLAARKLMRFPARAPVNRFVSVGCGLAAVSRFFRHLGLVLDIGGVGAGDVCSYTPPMAAKQHAQMLVPRSVPRRAGY